MELVLGIYILIIIIFFFGILRGMYLYFRDDDENKDNMVHYVWDMYEYGYDTFSSFMIWCFWILSISIFLAIAFELGNIFI